jgi:hypothetical protein
MNQLVEIVTQESDSICESANDCLPALTKTESHYEQQISPSTLDRLSETSISFVGEGKAVGLDRPVRLKVSNDIGRLPKVISPNVHRNKN